MIDILLVIQEGDGLPANNYSMECLDRQSSISGNSPTSTRTREHTLWALELVVSRVHVLEKCARGSLLGLSLFHSSDHIQQIAAPIKSSFPIVPRSATANVGEKISAYPCVGPASA